MADSSTGEFLRPTNVHESTEELEDFLHDYIVGVVGLPGDMVRPKWSRKAPPIPEAGVDWCSFGVLEEGDNGMPGVRHYGAGEGYSEVVNHEPFVVLVSFYGDNSRAYSRLLKKGITLSQNREYLYRRHMGVVDIGQRIRVPEIAGEVWNDRWDLQITFKRRTVDRFEIRNIKKCDVRIRNK